MIEDRLLFADGDLDALARELESAARPLPGRIGTQLRGIFQLANPHSAGPRQ